MVEKILKENAGKEHVVPGDIVITKPDMFMIHDIYTTLPAGDHEGDWCRQD